MPRTPNDKNESPKNYKMTDKGKKKKKSQESGSDSDSSSDYQPGDEVEEMNTLEMQKFIQKIFPSKSGSERINQLDKIDKMMDKKSKKKSKKKKKIINKKVKGRKNKKIKKKPKKPVSESDVEEDEEIENSDSEYNPKDFKDEEEDEAYEEYLEQLMNENPEMDMPMMGQGSDNMKFNIIFTVGKPGDRYGEEEEEEEEDSEAEYNSEEDGPEIEEVAEEEEEDEEEEEEEEEEEKEEEEKVKNTKKRQSARLKALKNKTCSEVTDEEWLELASEQEQEMKTNGTYYSTKYKVKDKVQMKLPGWNGLKNGIIKKIHRNKKPKLVKYDIKLKTKYNGKTFWKKVPSRRIKPSEENEEKELLNELKRLIDTKSGKSKKAMEKQFQKLTKAQEKKDKEKEKNLQEKKKHKNLTKLRKLLREKNMMNDYKFFKGLDLDVQMKIITKLQEINKFTNIEKPYKIKLIEANIPVEYKARALAKINSLEYMDPGSGEYYKIKTYVDNFMRIPFGIHKTLPITIDNGKQATEAFMENAKKILDEAVYGLEDAKMQIHN